MSSYFRGCYTSSTPLASPTGSGTNSPVRLRSPSPEISDEQKDLNDKIYAKLEKLVSKQKEYREKTNNSEPLLEAEDRFKGLKVYGNLTERQLSFIKKEIKTTKDKIESLQSIQGVKVINPNTLNSDGEEVGSSQRIGIPVRSQRSSDSD